jgi:GMP synthase-like glutamine amidotransferase
MSRSSGTPRALVFQHMESEGPGLLGELMTARGFQWQAVHLHRGDEVPALEDFDLMVVLGGVQDVWQEDLYPWLITEKAMIRRWVADLGKPYIGICLGHQLLADALGGEVGPAEQMEIGLCRIAVRPGAEASIPFARLPAETFWMQWHGAEVKRLPKGARALAFSEACAVQAMQVGDKAFGLQFHPEVTAESIECWATLPGFEPSVARVYGPGRAEAVKNEVLANLPLVHVEAAKLFTGLLDLALVRQMEQV